ncbi:ACT domain-containing protein [Alteromonas sp. CYL-A6]|uniref:ACT domain-containing protein n=1 Tax=Alteromonas nitratireducens TaxID=3390813 RepID=UPI0034A6FD72
MGGETELVTLLAQLHPEMDEAEYTFVCVSDLDTATPVLDKVRGLFVEKEGISLIVPTEVASSQQWEATGSFRCITCNVHSSLEAVGMTAAISAALTATGISANVVAAYYHDHLFVPTEQAEDALSALRRLSAGQVKS